VAYDFSPFTTVVDVGGATGNMLGAILAGHAGPRGVLFDLPHVVTDAPALLQARGVSGRVTIESGSFFDTVPAGGDAYVLSHIIHDWSEAQCLTILGHCRKAIKPDGHLLVVEMVLPSGDTPHPGKMLDIVMLVFPGGQERTEAEYGALREGRLPPDPRGANGVGRGRRGGRAGFYPPVSGTARLECPRCTVPIGVPWSELPSVVLDGEAVERPVPKPPRRTWRFGGNCPVASV
jgi:hypothetical protein